MEKSRKFGDAYVRLLTGGGEFSSIESQLAIPIKNQIQPLLCDIEGLSSAEIAKKMIKTYRAGIDRLCFEHGQQPIFGVAEINDEELLCVTKVKIGPFGVPVIYTSGGNEMLFGIDTLSFASSELMIENGQPPLVVIYNNYSDTERHRVTIHELSHALFALLRSGGVIPHPDEQELTVAGRKSAFELARDEAVAMMAADQIRAIHPKVIERMEQEGFGELDVESYRQSFYGFTKSTALAAGLKFSDAILGVMASKNFTELNTHMARMIEFASVG